MMALILFSRRQIKNKQYHLSCTIAHTIAGRYRSAIAYTIAGRYRSAIAYTIAGCYRGAIAYTIAARYRSAIAHTVTGRCVALSTCIPGIHASVPTADASIAA